MTVVRKTIDHGRGRIRPVALILFAMLKTVANVRYFVKLTSAFETGKILCLIMRKDAGAKKKINNTENCLGGHKMD